jgi:hypothetical protein
MITSWKKWYTDVPTTSETFTERHVSKPVNTYYYYYYYNYYHYNYYYYYYYYYY